MSAELSRQEEAIRSELEHARVRLDGLASELGAVDADLESLSDERRQIELVESVCASLEKLNELGGSDLFWQGFAGHSVDAHISGVRGRVDEFRARFSQLEDRRRDVVARLADARETSEVLEDDLDEVRKLEELKKQEWIVERDDDSPLFYPARMPWSRGGEEDARFRRSLLLALLLSLFLGGVLPMIDLPVPDQWEVVEVPERFTRLIKEEVVEPPPLVQERLEPEATRPETPEEPQELAKDTTPKSDPAPKVTETVASQGILALRDQFAGLAKSDPVAKLGARARIDRSGESASGNLGRSLVTSQTPSTSGGIDVASLGRDAVGGGGQALDGVQVARATSSIGTASGQGRPLSDGPGMSRTDEEIQIVFDRHKAALYRLYNRELRTNPTLKGQIVLKIVIEPDGSVSLCEVRSSDMDAPGLAAKVVERVRTFDFGAKDGIPPVSILYPIDFLPAA